MYSFLITVLMYDSVAEERILFDHDAGGGGGFLLQQEEYREICIPNFFIKLTRLGSGLTY